MEETHVCVVDRDGAIVYQGRIASTPTDIAAELTKTPACERAVFETGRMAPMLYHGLAELGVPVVCIESRQAHHAPHVDDRDRVPLDQAGRGCLSS